ncbi:MAG: hypothetical protein VX777_01245 [Chlamydiota bacterium]|nr:hypothetical protein [Chlamydiota bacterium]
MFDFKINQQSALIMNNTQTKLYEKVNALSNRSKGYKVLTHFLGFGVGVSSSVLTIASTVSTLGETIIKGLSNLFAAPFTKKCNFVTGLQQIFIGIPFSVLDIILCPIYVTLGTTITTFGMLFNPSDYTNDRMEAHNRVTTDYYQKNV